jgi:hypothetical protein
VKGDTGFGVESIDVDSIQLLNGSRRFGAACHVEDKNWTDHDPNDTRSTSWNEDSFQWNISIDPEMSHRKELSVRFVCAFQSLSSSLSFSLFLSFSLSFSLSLSLARSLARSLAVQKIHKAFQNSCAVQSMDGGHKVARKKRIQQGNVCFFFFPKPKVVVQSAECLFKLPRTVLT